MPCLLVLPRAGARTCLPSEPGPQVTAIVLYVPNCVSFLASLQFSSLQEIPCTVAQVRGKRPFGGACSFCNTTLRVLSVCHPPGSHGQGSGGHTRCSCWLASSADKCSGSLHHFWFLSGRMHDCSPNPLPPERRRERRGRKLWLAPTGTHQRQLARWQHAKGRGGGREDELAGYASPPDTLPVVSLNSTASEGSCLKCEGFKPWF